MLSSFGISSSAVSDSEESLGGDWSPSSGNWSQFNREVIKMSKISLPPHGDDDVDDPGKPAVGSQGSGAL